MKPCLILVDGMAIAHRGEVAKAIVSQFSPEEVEHFQCSEDVPAHLYVHMMKPVLERCKSIIIEGGWRADAVLEDMGHRFKVAKPFRRMLDRIALGCNVQIAYCAADGRTYAASWAKLQPSVPYDRVASTIDRMSKGWGEINSLGPLVTKINTSDASYSMDIEALMDRAQLHAQMNQGPGIGSWSPGKVMLLVGDRHGPSIQPYQINTNLAFCDMAKAGASYWLSNQLESSGIREDQLYWINAYDQRDEPTNPSFVERLQPKAILTLGDQASRWCIINGLRHEAFTHPQYHKRFHYNEPYPLIDRLRSMSEI